METTTFKNKNQALLILTLALIVTILFWLVGNTIDVYKYAAVGAIFEMAWFPVILATFTLPVISLVFFFKDGKSIKSWFLYLAIISVMLIVFYFLW